jgi:lactoylglutathione lyase
MVQTIAIERVDHIGIRVRDLDRALAFYRVLGFTLALRAVGDDVAIVRNEHGVELNLIFNANAGDPDSNILMDVPDKFAGYTHMALRVASIPATIGALRANDIAISQGPVSFGQSGQVSVFVRDPDRNVIELRGREQGVVEGVTRYGRDLAALFGGDAFPGDLTVFLDLTGPPGWRDQDHALRRPPHSISRPVTQQGFETDLISPPLAFPQTEKSARTRTDHTTTPGAARGTNGSNPAPSSGESDELPTPDAFAQLTPNGTWHPLKWVGKAKRSVRSVHSSRIPSATAAGAWMTSCITLVATGWSAGRGPRALVESLHQEHSSRPASWSRPG